MISVSAIPGGNPVARNDPENWAVTYGRCDTCKAHWCDRCMGKLAPKECPACKKPFTMFGVVDEKKSAPPAAKPTGVKPWWKFW